MSQTIILPNLDVENFDIKNMTFLGNGGFGEVYKVTCKFENTSVAVKIPKEKGDEALKMVRQEMRIMNETIHKNLTRLWGHFIYDNKYCLVFEFASQGSIYDYLIKPVQKRAVRSKERKSWMEDIARGLRYLHHDIETPVYHGDIKSLNILLFPQKQGFSTAKLGDFGLAIQLPETVEVGVGGGTSLWSAPEILRHEKKSLKSDVWAFGATLVEIFTSALPYAHCKGSPLNGVIEKKITPLTNMTKVNRKKIPDEITDMLHGCFEFDHTKRWSMEKIFTFLKAGCESWAEKKALRLYVWSPGGDFGGTAATLDAGSSCMAVLPAAAQLFSEIRIGNSAIIYSQEFTYERGGEIRHAMECYNEEAGEYKYLNIDSLDGTDVENSSILRYARRFLRPSSAMPFSLRLTPIITILSDTEVLAISPSGQLEAAPVNAMWNPTFVVMLQGVQHEKQKFYCLVDSSFVKGDSGEEFTNQKMIPGEEKRKRFFYELLRNDDPVPAAAVPEGKNLHVLRRAGLEVRIDSGRVRTVRALSSIDLEVWETPGKLDAFDKDLTAAARWK